jgi:cell division protein FtsW (lipid II flippase)
VNGSALLGHARRRPTEPEVDLTVLWIVALLLGLGLVMVYSASIAIAEAGRVSAGNPSYFLLRHASFLLIGLTACQKRIGSCSTTAQAASPISRKLACRNRK